MTKFQRRYKASGMFRLALLALVLLLTLLFYWLRPGIPELPPPVGDIDDESITLEYRGKPLRITQHGRCRMECRYISRADVAGLLNTAREDVARSRPDDSPCPSRAYQGYAEGNRLIRMVIAECTDEARLVTVIDLRREFDCAC